MKVSIYLTPTQLEDLKVILTREVKCVHPPDNKRKDCTALEILESLPVTPREYLTNGH